MLAMCRSLLLVTDQQRDDAARVSGSSVRSWAASLVRGRARDCSTQCERYKDTKNRTLGASALRL